MNGNINPQQVYRNTLNYPIQGPQYDVHGNLISKGHHPEPLNFKLEAQQQAIKSIAINNPKNLGTTVLVYGGPSSSGTPIFVCLPGKSARAPVEGNYPLHVKFDCQGGLEPGLPPNSGYIFIAVTSEMGPEIFSADSTSIDGGTVDIGIMPPVVIDTVGSSALGPLSVTVAGGITVNPPVYPPIGQIPVQTFIAPTITSSSFTPDRLQLDPLAAITNPLFTMAIGVGCFDRQPFLQWRFATRGTNGNYNLLIRGWGNRELIFPQPYYQTLRSLSAQGLFFDVINANSILGSLPINVFYAGYYS